MTQAPKFINKAKRAVPEITEDDYWEIRNELLDDGLVSIGRGRGGSVYLILEPKEENRTETEYESESDLYEPFYRTISTTWAKQNNIKSFVAEITAHQGRKNTGGSWTRPDVAVVSIGKYAFIPGKVLDVITFEIKTLDNFSITGLFEAAAHNAFAHRSFLAIHASKLDNSSPDLDRIKTEARRLGVGVVLFTNPAEWTTYETVVDPDRREPDPANVNLFISKQISSDRQTELLEMMK